MHARNTVRWCLKKAADELEQKGTHRGLVKREPDSALARLHLVKAEHNLRAIIAFKDAGFSDWSASAAFYAIYHSLLASLAKRGYESRNQVCTFAFIQQLVDQGDLLLEKRLLLQIHALDPDAAQETTALQLREAEQYGVATSLEDGSYERLLALAKTILDHAKIDLA